MAGNGDTDLVLKIGKEAIHGIGSFHKTLKCNDYGEVDPEGFRSLVAATRGNAPTAFAGVPPMPKPKVKESDPCIPAPLVNPQAGLSHDRLTPHPYCYEMGPAPRVRSISTAAEMTELYWMAELRDVYFDEFPTEPRIDAALAELNLRFGQAVADKDDAGRLEAGVDLPGKAGALAKITRQNIFRLGLPGEEVGPMISQFFLRDVAFGTQTIDQRELPYRTGRNYLYQTKAWLTAQRTGYGADGKGYSDGNESKKSYFEEEPRFISTMRDLARFVHKDALHQAYFNAALLLLSGGAKWTKGNPYRGKTNLDCLREQGFGTLGGPHILALVSEVATRALKVVWHQKWQTHLRLRPEAYGGLVHFQTIGGNMGKRAYGLPKWVGSTAGAKAARKRNKAGWKDATTGEQDPGEATLFLPMAFTSGSPIHPAYGAGHATVAGACVTVLKAYFDTVGVKITELGVKAAPYAKREAWVPMTIGAGGTSCYSGDDLTVEGELNKLAQNVAMGRSMGGVHWRSDNTRSLMLGEAIAAHILADITRDVAEDVAFEFQTFARKASDGKPKKVVVTRGAVIVDGQAVDPGSSRL